MNVAKSKNPAVPVAVRESDREDPRRLETEVLIVGGGPAGMIAALCLDRLGVANIVLEQRATPARHPKAHELSARSIEILRDLGFSRDELVAEASDQETASRVLFCGNLREEFGRIDLNRAETRAKYAEHHEGPEAYLNISQTELERIMRRRVAAGRCINLLPEHRWLSSRQTKSYVHSSVLIRGRRPSRIEIRSRFVICADGAGGTCRQALGISMIGPERLQDFANVYFTNDLRDRLPTKAKLYWILLPEAAGVLIAHHPEKRWVYHVPVQTPYEKIEDYTPEVFQKRLRAAFNDESLRIDIQSISSWRMTAQVAERFRDGRIFLIGDAAHRFPPTGGLGMNSGIADAHNLCWKIKAVLRGEAHAALLDTYESERKPVIEHNCAESRRNYEGIQEVVRAFGLRPDGLNQMARWMRRAPLAWLSPPAQDAFRAVVHSRIKSLQRRFFTRPAVRTRVVRAIAGQIGHFDRIGLDLGYRYEVGAIIPDDVRPEPPNSDVTQYRPSTRPGSRLPHFATKTETGQRISSHRLVGYDGWTMLTGPDISNAWRRALKQLDYRVPLRLVTIDLFQLGLPADALLLVRPDGQIAWRRWPGKPAPENDAAHDLKNDSAIISENTQAKLPEAILEDVLNRLFARPRARNINH